VPTFPPYRLPLALAERRRKQLRPPPCMHPRMGGFLFFFPCSNIATYIKKKIPTE